MNLTQLPAVFKETVSSILNNTTPEMKNSFSNDLKELLCLAMEMPGKLNYTQLGRMGTHTEKTSRTAFSKPVDWPSINMESIFQTFSPDDRLSLVMDPAFIRKAGQSTPCVGSYWSGSDGCMKHGLEITAIGVSDLEEHDCMILTAPLTPGSELLKEENVNLRRWYLMAIASCHDALVKICSRVTADAFFATKDFCDGLQTMGFDLISRLRDNACLRYLHTASGSGTPHRGRPQRYDGQLDLLHPDMNVFREFHLQDVKGRFLTATLNSRALHRDVVVAIYYPPRRHPKIYFSTDLTLSGEMVAQFYKLRFQIEFCIRDAKQFCGLGDSQSRKYRAMGFAMNLSFAALDMAKLVIHKEHLAISAGQFHLIMMLVATATRINSRSADPPTSKLLAIWDGAIRKLAGVSSMPA